MRDRSSGTWQTAQSVPFHYLAFATTLRKGKPIIANNWLNEIYRANYSSFTTDGSIIGHSYRSISGSTWTENQDFLYTPIDKLNVVSNTNNNRIHIIYYDELEGNYIHKYLSGTIFSNVVAAVPLFEQSSFLSSNSNDLYLLRVNNPDTPSKIKFRHYDDAPLAPTGLTITEDANHHPKLNWNVSPEPDRNVYKIYRYDTYGGGWQYLNQTPNTTYTDQTLTYCQAIPPAQCPDVRTFYFRITVVDFGSHESLPSNQVEARLQGGPPPKIVVDPNSNEPIEYSLNQNYPNPFNPSTTINYSIKSAGDVSLKVYDILGTEVASLVNEVKEPGNYSVTFDATKLPSGMYVYILSAGNFIDTKKLILLK